MDLDAQHAATMRGADVVAADLEEFTAAADRPVARAAHRLPVQSLKRGFACLLYALATKMVVSYW